MSCTNCKLLEERLKHYEGRAQRLLDLVASSLEKMLQEDPSPTVLSVARQLLRDNGIVDLRGETRINHLAKNYPFTPPDEDGIRITELETKVD